MLPESEYVCVLTAYLWEKVPPASVQGNGALIVTKGVSGIWYLVSQKVYLVSPLTTLAVMIPGPPNNPDYN